jgi:nitroimidazol reductase NimA-like FMN-containing flavoprotein (pyridoxamine 5'-phosphate oxidase superfamily)
MQAFTAEQQAFLLEGTRTGKLATVRKDGRLHVVPIWFVLDGDTLVFTTGEASVKAANLRKILLVNNGLLGPLTKYTTLSPCEK